MFAMYLNTNFFVDILINLLNHIDVIAILLITIPGATCYTIGFRIAAFTRFLFSIVYKGDGKSFFEDSNRTTKG